MPRANFNRRRQQQKAYARVRRQRQAEAAQARETEQPDSVPVDELLQLQLQHGHAQQPAVPIQQPEQRSEAEVNTDQLRPTPNAAGGEGMQTDARWMPPQPFQFFPQPLPQPQQMQQGAVQPAEEQPAAPAIPQQNANPPPQNHDLHRMAPMNSVCTHCGAKYFKEELNTIKKYPKCCREGAVHLPAIQPPPAVLMPLFLGDTEDTQRDSKDFLSKFRQYNATMAMASWTANIPKFRQGAIRNNNTWQCISQDRDLNKDIIKKLQDELLAVNPYAQEYKHIGDILQQQKEQATAANEPIPTFDMIITSRANQDRRYDTPAASEIAAIYSTKDGGAPDPNERTMHIQRRDGYLINIKATNPAAIHSRIRCCFRSVNMVGVQQSQDCHQRVHKSPLTKLNGAKPE
eukprot:gene2097-biopygen1881